jgi:hypothetical protein
LVIVDEAHTCAATGQGRHQRYELLKGLVEKPRHLASYGDAAQQDEDAFYRLGLLQPEFQQLLAAAGETRCGTVSPGISSNAGVRTSRNGKTGTSSPPKPKN